MMCGRDAGIVIQAILEMVTTVLNAAFSLADNIMQMQEHGVNAELLTATIQVFIDMGKPFANPTCEVVTGAEETGTQLPAPTPTPSTGDGSDFPDIYCTSGRLFLSSHQGLYISDQNGNPQLTWSKQGWEMWTLSKDIDNKSFFITSHREAKLSDHNGRVQMSPNRADWEKWTLRDAGDGKFFVRSHRGQYLQDHYGNLQLSWNSMGWEKWSVTTLDGNPACEVVTTASTTSPSTSEAMLVQMRKRAGASL
jgi:hypothetical protein